MPVQSNDFSALLRQIWSAIRFRWVVIIGVIFLTVGAIYYYSLRAKNVYSAKVSMVIQKTGRKSTILDLSQDSKMSNFGPAPIEEQLRRFTHVLNSDVFYLRIARKVLFNKAHDTFGLLQLKSFFLDPEAIDRLEGRALDRALSTISQELMNLLRVSNDGIETIFVSVSLDDPHHAMNLTNLVSEEFIQSTNESEIAEIKELKLFILKQLESTSAELKLAEQSLVEFKQQKGIISVEQENRSFEEKTGRIENEISTLQVQIDQSKKLIQFYEARLQAKEDSLMEQSSVSSVNSQKNKLALKAFSDLEVLSNQKAMMVAEGYAEDHWRLQEINREAASVGDELKKKFGLGKSTSKVDFTMDLNTIREKLSELRDSHDKDVARLDSIQKSKGSLQRDLERLPQNEQKMAELERKAKLKFELSTALEKRLQDLNIQEQSITNQVGIIQAAGLPTAMPRPKAFLVILFGIFCGLFIGTTIAFGLDIIDPRIKSALEWNVGGCQVIGEIPVIPDSQSKLVIQNHRNSIASMAFRDIREHIKGHLADPIKAASAKVILVTGSDVSDGKSLVSANLAVAFAQLGKNTLLIDCDLRNPGVAKYFDIKETEGLTSIISMQKYLDDVLIEHPGSKLNILLAGTQPNSPSECLAGDRFKFFMNFLRNEYDYIILDAPPATHLVDAGVLSAYSDVTLLVASQRRSKKASLALAAHKIRSISGKGYFGVFNRSESMTQAIHKSSPYFSGNRVSESTDKLEMDYDLMEALPSDRIENKDQ